MKERPGAVVDLGAKVNLKSFYPPAILNVDGSNANEAVDVVVYSISSLNGFLSAGAKEAIPE